MPLTPSYLPQKPVSRFQAFKDIRKQLYVRNNHSKAYSVVTVTAVVLASTSIISNSLEANFSASAKSKKFLMGLACLFYS
jgi:hypothetical protein